MLLVLIVLQYQYYDSEIIVLTLVLIYQMILNFSYSSELCKPLKSSNLCKPILMIIKPIFTLL